MRPPPPFSPPPWCWCLFPLTSAIVLLLSGCWSQAPLFLSPSFAPFLFSSRPWTTAVLFSSYFTLLCFSSFLKLSYPWPTSSFLFSPLPSTDSLFFLLSGGLFTSDRFQTPASSLLSKKRNLMWGFKEMIGASCAPLVTSSFPKLPLHRTFPTKSKSSSLSPSRFSFSGNAPFPGYNRPSCRLPLTSRGPLCQPPSPPISATTPFRPKRLAKLFFPKLDRPVPSGSGSCYRLPRKIRFYVSFPPIGGDLGLLLVAAERLSALLHSSIFLACLRGTVPLGGFSFLFLGMLFDSFSPPPFLRCSPVRSLSFSPPTK